MRRARHPHHPRLRSAGLPGARAGGGQALRQRRAHRRDRNPPGRQRRRCRAGRAAGRRGGQPDRPRRRPRGRHGARRVRRRGGG
nr:hypothetical protein [Rhizobacter sp. Root1221]